jgi:FAD/FMN-containing dehydrogenase
LEKTKSKEELIAMKALKLAFDPKNILNPGKIID